MIRTAASQPYATRALVLRSRPTGEKDRLLSLVAPERGLWTALARGARNPGSKLSSAGQPFVLGRFLLSHGRKLDTISQVEIETTHTGLTHHLFRSLWAGYLCELVLTQPEHLPEQRIFDLLLIALDALESATSAKTAALIGHWFEAHFLQCQGWTPQIGSCAACGRKITIPRENGTRAVAFSPSRGGTLCEQCAPAEAGFPLSAAALRLWHRLQGAPGPPGSAQPEGASIGQDTLRQLATGLRGVLASCLELHARSWKVLDEMSGEDV